MNLAYPTFNFLKSLPLIVIAAASLSCRQAARPNQANASSSTPTPMTFNGPPGFPPPVMDKPYPGTGVIVSINRAEGWVEINHEEIKDLMPAMQMEFLVKDRRLLDYVRVGDKVDFTVVETAKGEYVTELKKSAAVRMPSP